MRVLKALTTQPSSQSTQAGSPTWPDFPDPTLHSHLLQSQQVSTNGPPSVEGGKIRCSERGSMLGLEQLPPHSSSGLCPPSSALWTLGLTSSVVNKAAGPKGPRCSPLPGGPQGPEHMPSPKDGQAQRGGLPASGIHKDHLPWGQQGQSLQCHV